MTSRLENNVEDLELRVPGMSCDHCVAAVRGEISKVTGVTAVDVDLPSKRVVVHGRSVDAAAVRVAIEEAGYESQS
jgi:copper chaperone